MKFTWHEKFTKLIEHMPNEDVAVLMRAVCEYGSFGKEPELEYPLCAMFETIREDIDFSHDLRETRAEAGKKGGRPKKDGVPSHESSTTSAHSDDTDMEEKQTKTRQGECTTCFNDEKQIKANKSKLKQTKANETKSKQAKANESARQDIAIHNIKEKEIDKEKEPPPFAEIVSYLNEKTGYHYESTSESTKRLIRARYHDGYTYQDFVQVIDAKCTEWLNDVRMKSYLRPETLFSTKFSTYLGQSSAQRVVGGFDVYD